MLYWGKYVQKKYKVLFIKHSELGHYKISFF
jgi:hypothetical protein